MRSGCFALLFFVLASFTTETLSYFTPPLNWQPLDSQEIAKKYRYVKYGYVGHSKKELPPSLNLAVEEIGNLSLTDYLDSVKKIHEADPNILEWKDKGLLQTEAGKAKITQIVRNTELGSVLLLQLIFIQEQKAYILTASALKEEFVLFYKEFEASFHSFHIPKKTKDNKSPSE